MKELTIEEAKQIIEEFPDQDDFVNLHFSASVNFGEYDDNSVEMARLWRKYRDLVDKAEKLSE